MNITNVPTFTATIYVGTYDRDNKTTETLDTIKEVCQKYVNDVGLCVTVTPTTFIYTFGQEEGAAIGLINYPRFPSRYDEIYLHAINLGKLLLDKLNQYRVSVVMNNITYMISKDNIEE